MIAKPLNGQSFIDLAVQQCGSVDSAVLFALLNDASLSDTELTGELIAPPIANKKIASLFSKQQLKPATILSAAIENNQVDFVASSSAISSTENSNYVTALGGQSLIDIAIQTCGSVESAVLYALLNEVSITDVVETKTLQRPNIAKPEIVKWFAVNNAKPASSILGESAGSGIGYWAIGVDFIVS